MRILSLSREPLVHFFVLGAVLFGLYGWIRGETPEAPDQIVVDSFRVTELKSGFERLWRRQPTPTELAGLVDDWVRKEIMYREGVALGLDRDDPVLRQRVAQKVKFMLEQLDTELPTEEELQTWLDTHAQDYRIEPTFSFRQVFVDPVRHGEALDATIEGMRESLATGAEASSVGDATLLPEAMAGAASTEVRHTFGDDFADALPELTAGRWLGPVRSAYGLHLVYLDAMTPGRAATLADVRTAVERDMEVDSRRRAEQSAYETLRERYAVRIDEEALFAARARGVGDGE